LDKNIINKLYLEIKKGKKVGKFGSTREDGFSERLADEWWGKNLDQLFLLGVG